jgi:uncharacterized membrane protein YheB (UPF0754 family)
MNFNYSYILLPIVAATIGWFTNYIAVKMLFNPKKPIKILWFTVQGIFPKRQAEIAISVGKMVANDLLHARDIQQSIGGEKNVRAIIDKIEETLDHYFEYKFPEKFPLLSKVISSKIRSKIKDEMLEEVELMAPKLIENQVNQLGNVFDVEEIVTRKVSELSSEKLEGLMLSIIEKELSFIEWVGAVLGFIIGLVQVLLVIWL